MHAVECNYSFLDDSVNRNLKKYWFLAVFGNPAWIAEPHPNRATRALRRRPVCAGMNFESYGRRKTALAKLRGRESLIAVRNEFCFAKFFASPRCFTRTDATSVRLRKGGALFSRGVRRGRKIRSRFGP